MNDTAPTASYVSSTSTLCAPALTYLVISLAALLVSWFQNLQNTKVYCVGQVSCPVQNTTYVFVLKIMWFLFWTWVLNSLCAKGYKTVAWILVAIPFLVFFTLMFGLANMLASGSGSGSGSGPSGLVPAAGTTAYNGKASNKLPPSMTAVNNPPNEYIHGNKGNKMGVYPNETNTQYSSYAGYDANLDNRSKFLDRESKGNVQPMPTPQQPQQPQQPQ